MSEAKPLTAAQESLLRKSEFWGLRNVIAAQIWATLDAERAKVEALERLNAAAAADGLSKIADHWRARATAAEAEAERQKGLAADLAQALNSATSGLHGLSLQGAEAALHRYALAKEKPDAAE